MNLFRNHHRRCRFWIMTNILMPNLELMVTVWPGHSMTLYLQNHKIQNLPVNGTMLIFWFTREQSYFHKMEQMLLNFTFGQRIGKK